MNQGEDDRGADIQRDFGCAGNTEDVLDNLLEGLQIIDRDYRYAYVNEAAARHGRLAKEQLLGRAMADLYPGIDRTAMFSVLRQCMQDRTPRQLENEFEFPDGTKQWFELRFEPVAKGVLILSLDISARKYAERRFRSLLDAVSDVVWAATPDGKEFLYLSPSVEAVYGRTRAEFLANPWLWNEAVHPDDRELALHEADRLDETGSVACTYRIVRPDGAVRWLYDRKTLVRDEQGNVVHKGGLATDITEWKMADAALRESEHRYRFLFEHMGEGLAYCRMLYDGDEPVDFVYLAVNGAFEKVTGLGNVTGRKVTELIPDVRESHPILFERCGRVARGLGPERFELYVNTLGEWLDISAYSSEGDDHFVTVFDVVTERKRAEENLRRFTEQLERLARVAQELSQARTVAAIVEIVRRAARELAGADGATFVLREGDFCHYVDEDAIEPLWKGKKFHVSTCVSGWVMTHREQAAIDDVYADARVPHDAYRTTFVKSLVMTPIRTQDPIGAIGAYWSAPCLASDEARRVLQALADSTSIALENVRVLAELAEGKARTRAIYEHLPTTTFVWQRRGDELVLTDFNEAARKMTQGAATDCVGKAPQALLGGLPHLGEDLAHVLEQHTPVRREVRYDLPGALAPCQLALTYGYIPNDMVLLHAEDVTGQRQTEEQLRVAQRLESVGRLAGGVAHDFNNLLSVILTSVDFAISSEARAEVHREDLEEIRKAAQRAAVLTRQLLAFSRRQPLQPEVVSLNEIVKSMEPLLRRLIGEDIELTTLLGTELGYVKVDPGQIEQVVMNLAVNARDAMPKGGKLTIETLNVELDDAYAMQHVSARAGPYVCLCVTDNGCGMDEQTRAHLFEPFFTTKEAGKGTGLGLATVYGIVKQSGGNIWVHSEPGRGTVLKIYLPREFAKPGARPPSTELPVRSEAAETILIVEDEAAVREAARRILGAGGYRVLTAANGSEALDVCERHVGEVHLVLTDMVMPGMSGRELAERLRAARPGIAVLYTSGYAEDALGRQGFLDAGANFVGKPFDAALLVRRVRDVLDRTRSSGQREGSPRPSAPRISGREGEPADGSRHGAEADVPKAMGVRILLIEDNPICQEATACVLAEQGHSVSRADTGQAGLAALDVGDIDLVITDLGLPDMPYGVLLDQIRERAGDIPVIMLSAETGSAALFDAIHRGVFDYVSKGEHRSLLEAAVHRVVERLRLAKEKQALLERLRRLTSELEAQVIERTRALEETNTRLVEEIVERRRVETELRLAQKLEAVGQLAAGIAHEINTPTQFVGDSVHFIAESFQDALGVVDKYRQVTQILAALPEHAQLAREMHEAEERADLDYVLENLPAALERALDGVARISAIVGAMKEFAHPDHKEKSAADLNRAINATLTIARNEYKYVADVETDFGELPPVMCHLGDLNQVFLNLIVNAAHAIADVMATSGQRGTIRIRTRYEAPMARIDIEDTGCGIPEAIRTRVFDPFFTTKEVGKGSGQGLAIARSIVVDKHHGTLTFDTEVGRGTTFSIVLPIDGCAADSMGPEPGSLAGSRR